MPGAVLHRRPGTHANRPPGGGRAQRPSPRDCGSVRRSLAAAWPLPGRHQAPGVAMHGAWRVPGTGAGLRRSRVRCAHRMAGAGRDTPHPHPETPAVLVRQVARIAPPASQVSIAPRRPINCTVQRPPGGCFRRKRWPHRRAQTALPTPSPPRLSTARTRSGQRSAHPSRKGPGMDACRCIRIWSTRCREVGSSPNII